MLLRTLAKGHVLTRLFVIIHFKIMISLIIFIWIIHVIIFVIHSLWNMEWSKYIVFVISQGKIIFFVKVFPRISTEEITVFENFHWLPANRQPIRFLRRQFEKNKFSPEFLRSPYAASKHVTKVSRNFSM